MSSKEIILSGLHDLCQPLTAIECRLSIALMDLDGVADSRGCAVEAIPALRLALEESLTQCRRMMPLMRAVQDAASGMSSS